MKKVFTLFLLLPVCMGFARQPGAPYRNAKGFQYIDTVLNAGPENRFIPVLVAFMHLGATPGDIIANYDGLKQPVHVIIPMGNGNGTDVSAYFTADCYNRDAANRDKRMRKTIDSLADFVHAINQQYHCRAFVSGFLQGGDIALMLSVYHPTLVIASFPLAAAAPGQVNVMLRAGRAGYVPIYLYKGGDEEPVTVKSHEDRVTVLSGYRNIYLTVYPHQKNTVSAKMKHDYSAMMDEQLEQYRVNFSGKRLDKYYPHTDENVAAAASGDTRSVTSAR